MTDTRRCGLCGVTRSADRITLHVYMRHRDWWWQQYGPRPPAVTIR